MRVGGRVCCVEGTGKQMAAWKLQRIFLGGERDDIGWMYSLSHVYECAPQVIPAISFENKHHLHYRNNSQKKKNIFK